MMWKALLLFLLFVAKVGTAFEVMSAWSNWTSCPIQTNCTARSLQCWTRDQPQNPVMCRHGNQTVMEELYNCTSCNGSWGMPEVTHSCVPSCYNSSMWQKQKCSSDPSCILKSKILCNDLSLCTGSWAESNTSCNATCTAAGIITTTSTCINNNIMSFTCAETYGIVQERTTYKVCPALSWSSWKPGECSVTCGGGKLVNSRTCGPTTEMRNTSCNTEDCPGWSKWSEDSSCLNNVGTRTRMCMYLGSVYQNCSGSGPFQVRLRQCNSTTAEEMNPICPDTLYTFTIPVVVGLTFLFALILVAMLLLFKWFTVHRRLIKENVDFVCENSPATVHTNCNGTETQDNIVETERPTNKVVPYKVPLKDADIEEGPVNPKYKKQRSKSMDSRLYSHREVPEIAVDDSDIFSSNLHMKETDVGDLVDESSLFTKQEWHSLRPSVRRAYRQKLKNPEDASWQRTQTLKHSKNQKETNISPRHRRTHSEGGVLDGGPVSLSPPSKPVRKNSSNQKSLRSASVSQPPKPVKPMRTHKMRRTSFNASTWYINSSHSEAMELDGHSYSFGSLTPAKSAPQLDRLCDTTLGSLQEVPAENDKDCDLEEDAS